MKVMVLGGTGFIGCHLVKRLANNGFDVVVPVRKESNKGKLVSRFSASGGGRFT